jgi:hypothetical protein
MHTHSKTHHKLVRQILRLIASQDHRPLPEIKHKFVVDGDLDITLRFWELLKKIYPKHHFTDVYHCPGCKKFSLE